MNKISLSDWAKVAEIGAAIGVIITLIFVGLELQNNAKATEAATRQAALQVGLEYLSLRVDSSVLARAHAKKNNGEKLSPDEKYQLVHEQYINFAGFSHNYYQYRQGFLNSDEWSRRRNIVESLINTNPYSQIMWEQKSNQFAPEFQELVNSLTSE